MALLVAGVRADEFDDYMAAVYRGTGNFVRVGNTYVGSRDIVTKAGSAYVSSRGIATCVGSAYITEDNRIVTRAGSTIIDGNNYTTRAGNAYSSNRGISYRAGSYLYKPSSLDGPED